MNTKSGMAKMGLVLSLFIFLGSCARESADPALQEVNGEWRLVKIVNGFAQTTQEGAQLGRQESLRIDATTRSFRKTTNGQVSANSEVVISSRNGRPTLLLLDRNSYHYYAIIPGAKKTLILYEEAPIGAELMDGSSYYYEL